MFDDVLDLAVEVFEAPPGDVVGVEEDLDQSSLDDSDAHSAFGGVGDPAHLAGDPFHRHCHVAVPWLANHKSTPGLH